MHPKGENILLAIQYEDSYYNDLIKVGVFFICVCGQRHGRVQETQLKCTKARNDYLLNLAAANAEMNKYYLQDVSTLIDVRRKKEFYSTVCLHKCVPFSSPISVLPAVLRPWFPSLGGSCDKVLPGQQVAYSEGGGDGS